MTEQTRENAAKQLQILAEETAKSIDPDANEAETRLRLVDKVLRIIGWEEVDFRPEERAGSGGFTDYLLTAEAIPRLIVEAKRIGHSFLRRNHTALKKSEYALSYIQTAFDQGFGDVLQQARSYAVETGVPFALLTNGREWILCQLIPPPGRDLADLKCFYFGNILLSPNNFDLMWSLVSKPAVLDGQLEESLSSVNSIEAEYCIEPRSLLGELRWHSTPGQKDNFLEEFYRRFFDEIVDRSRRHMLEHCYVTNPRLDQFESELRRTLEDLTPAYIEDAQDLAPADTDKILPGNLGEHKGRVVLVVGSVGAGKTTFVTKTMIINKNSSGMKFIHMDLIDEVMPGQEWAHFTPRLWKKLYNEWHKERPEAFDFKLLRQTFHSELETLRRGPLARVFEKDSSRYDEEEANYLKTAVDDQENFLIRSWSFFRRTKNQTLILFLDNVDRASESMQRGLYALAHQISSESGATVIVTMRESTYFRAREGGFLDIRSDKVFHLQSPDVVQLLSRRIDYVLVHSSKDHRLSEWKKDPQWQNFLSAAQTFAKTLKATFLQAQDKAKNVGILAAVAWHNVRYFLRVLSRIHKVLGPDYEEWSIAEIISALLSLSLSDEGGQVSTSLYRPVAKKHKCFFLKIRALIFLAHGLKPQEQRRGVPIKRLIGFLKNYGYRDSWIRGSLEELVQERMIECLEIPTEIEFTAQYRSVDSHSFRLSPLGTVMLDSIQFERVFLVMMGWELPIHSPNRMKVFDREARLVGAGDIELRLDRDKLKELIASPIPEVVVSILSECLETESLVSGKQNVRHEIKTTEEWTRRFIDKMRKTVDKDLLSLQEDIPTPSERPQSSQAQQELNLNSPAGLSAVTETHFVMLKIPPNILSLKIGSSTTAPLIFWALAASRLNGAAWITGSEITRIINDRLLDDEHRLHSTNVSKSLRGNVLRAQKWLAVREGQAGGHPLFSLADCWRLEWRRLFGETPPGDETL